MRRLAPEEVIHSYLWAQQACPNSEEKSFDDWVCNRFGRRLFEIFFRTYTEKVWGMKCGDISAEWAAQRIKDLDLLTALKEMFVRSNNEITTLIRQ